MCLFYSWRIRILDGQARTKTPTRAQPNFTTDAAPDSSAHPLPRSGSGSRCGGDGASPHRSDGQSSSPIRQSVWRALPSNRAGAQCACAASYAPRRVGTARADATRLSIQASISDARHPEALPTFTGFGKRPAVISLYSQERLIPVRAITAGRRSKRGPDVVVCMRMISERRNCRPSPCRHDRIGPCCAAKHFSLGGVILRSIFTSRPHRFRDLPWFDFFSPAAQNSLHAFMSSRRRARASLRR